MFRFAVLLSLSAVFWAHISLGSASASSAPDRRLSLFVNPGCGDQCANAEISDSFINLVYVKAEGDNDTLHYIWSSIGSFSILMASTDRKSELTIDWTEILSSNQTSSIKFSPPERYSAAVVFTRLWAYKDVNDNADISQASINLTTAIPFGSFSWEKVDAKNLSDIDSRAEFVLSTDVGSTYGNHTLKLILHAFGDTEHFHLLPKLPHTSSSLQMEMILDGFTAPFNHSTRFALEMALVSSSEHQANTEHYEIDKPRSIDDEYTPGVFTTVHIQAPRSRESDLGSFMVWKPICYTMSDRTTEDSTDTHETIGNISISERSQEIQQSLANAFYGADLIKSLVAFVNVSFGLEKDGFYDGTNFMSWTMVVGLGSPPEETFSTLVIIVIIVGFGIPTLLIIVGGMFVVVKRWQSRGNELQLNNHRHQRLHNESTDNENDHRHSKTVVT